MLSYVFKMCFNFLFVCIAPACCSGGGFFSCNEQLLILSLSFSICGFLTVHSLNTALKTKLSNHNFIIILQSHNIIYFQNKLRDEEQVET